MCFYHLPAVIFVVFVVVSKLVDIFISALKRQSYMWVHVALCVVPGTVIILLLDPWLSCQAFTLESIWLFLILTNFSLWKTKCN